MSNHEVPNIHLEGKDSVGKGDAAKNTVASLLFSKEIHFEGRSYSPQDVVVLQTDFPQYWGLGALIRKMNSRQVGGKYFAEKSYSPEETLHLRKAMYAIDRLVTLLVMENIPKDPNKLYIHISDRGPYSQTVTHAVCFTEKNRYLHSLESVVDADECYVSRVNPRSILLDAAESGIGGNGGRGELDELEKPLYQQLSEKGFEWLLEQPEAHMTKVVTRKGKQWRPRQEIATEILDSIGVECTEMPDFEKLKARDFAGKRRSGNLVQIGATELMNYLYPSISPEENLELSGIHNFDLWRKVAYFSNGDDISPIVGNAHADKKEIIVNHEELNSKQIGRFLLKNPLAPRAIPEDIRLYAYYLITEYTGGELLELVHYLDKLHAHGRVYSESEKSGYVELLRTLFVPEVRYW
ncbi:MAG: hypothetical protein ACOYT9_04760 [Patescibacteria group bacterium]